MDKLHDDDGLANTGAAKQSNLSTTRIGFQQVNDLDTRFKRPYRDVLVQE